MVSYYVMGGWLAFITLKNEGTGRFNKAARLCLQAF